jgi:rhamnulokinase
MLSGVGKGEESLISTSQLYNPRTNAWSRKLISTLKIPIKLFPPIVESATRLGSLREEFQEQFRLPGAQVVASCSHDTGAAVAAVPGEGDSWAYISSGTWSLMGIEILKPIVTDRARDLNFTNEIGVAGTTRLLKNIVGLWIIQECRRHWACDGQEYSYDELTRLARNSEPFHSLVDPNDPRFHVPGDMPSRIDEFCRETGQPVPSNPGAVIRCALESLALRYRKTLAELNELAERPIRTIHVVGGGCQNELLNQMTADACGVLVKAGPIEATAIGNVLVQAIAMDQLSSLAAARRLVSSSFTLRNYEPSNSVLWAGAEERWTSFSE